MAFILISFAFKFFLVSLLIICAFLTMFVKDMHSKILSLIPLLHILLRELILSAWHHVAFFLLIYQLFIFLFFLLFLKFYFNFSLSFLPSLLLPPPFVFLLSSAYSANLEFLSGIGFHYLVRRPLKQIQAWPSLGFLCQFCTVSCAAMLHERMFAWLHAWSSQAKIRSSRLFVSSVICVEMEDCNFFMLVQSTFENQKVLLWKRTWMQVAASAVFYFRGVKRNGALEFVCLVLIDYRMSCHKSKNSNCTYYFIFL